MPVPSPLSKSELADLQETADTRGYFSEQLIVNIVPYTGLYAKEFAHLRESWIRWGDDDEPILIDVPTSDTCSPLQFSSRSTVVERTEPCSQCRRVGETNGWEAGGTSRVRSIPVSDPNATSQLESWFQFYSAIPLSALSVGHTLDAVVQNSSLSRSVSVRELRLTFVRILAAMGFSLDLILEWSGYVRARDPIRTILDESPNGYRERLRPKEYLRILYHKGPMTVSELSDETDRTPQTVVRELNRLQHAGYAQESGTRASDKRGSDPGLWKCTEVPTTFECTECSAEFRTLLSLSNHSVQKHGYSLLKPGEH